jgi:hypothetical protein
MSDTTTAAPASSAVDAAPPSHWANAFDKFTAQQHQQAKAGSLNEPGRITESMLQSLERAINQHVQAANKNTGSTPPVTFAWPTGCKDKLLQYGLARTKAVTRESLLRLADPAPRKKKDGSASVTNETGVDAVKDVAKDQPHEYTFWAKMVLITYLKKYDHIIPYNHRETAIAVLVKLGYILLYQDKEQTLRTPAQITQIVDELCELSLTNAKKATNSTKDNNDPVVSKKTKTSKQSAPAVTTNVADVTAAATASAVDAETKTDKMDTDETQQPEQTDTAIESSTTNTKKRKRTSEKKTATAAEQATPINAPTEETEEEDAPKPKRAKKSASKKSKTTNDTGAEDSETTADTSEAVVKPKKASAKRAGGGGKKASAAKKTAAAVGSTTDSDTPVEKVCFTVFWYNNI